MDKYLFCHACHRGYEIDRWTPKQGVAAVDADPETTPLRHRECPNGHQFQEPECWQTAQHYQSDRERERLVAIGQLLPLVGPDGQTLPLPDPDPARA